MKPKAFTIIELLIAVAILTLVKDTRIHFKRPIVDQPRDDVRVQSDASFPLSIPVYVYRAVTAGDFTACPFPARPQFRSYDRAVSVDFIPEPLRECRRKVLKTSVGIGSVIGHTFQFNGWIVFAEPAADGVSAQANLFFQIVANLGFGARRN